MVTRQERETYEAVLERDLWMTWRATAEASWETWRASHDQACIAPLVSPDSGSCSGQTTFDHIWQHAGGTKGKRPPTTMETVSAICHGHHLWSPWATSHHPEIRIYIRRANEDYRRWLVSGRDQSR